MMFMRDCPLTADLAQAWTQSLDYLESEHQKLLKSFLTYRMRYLKGTWLNVITPCAFSCAQLFVITSFRELSLISENKSGVATRFATFASLPRRASGVIERSSEFICLSEISTLRLDEQFREIYSLSPASLLKRYHSWHGLSQHRIGQGSKAMSQENLKRLRVMCLNSPRYSHVPPAKVSEFVRILTVL